MSSLQVRMLAGNVPANHWHIQIYTCHRLNVNIDISTERVISPDRQSGDGGSGGDGGGGGGAADDKACEWFALQFNIEKPPDTLSTAVFVPTKILYQILNQNRIFSKH